MCFNLPEQVSDSPPIAKEEEKPKPVVETPKPKPDPLSAKPKVEIKQQEDGVIDGLQGALSDLKSTVKKHEARIAALEELSHVLVFTIKYIKYIV